MLNCSPFESGYCEFQQILDDSAIDQILFRLAESAMRKAGHRYGAFLDAATTAAKLAIYMTYLEENQNLRKTGRLHHLEPKRVKEIVHEIQGALLRGKLLKVLGSQEPRYLIGLPYLWQQQHPWRPGQPRLINKALTPSEINLVEEKLPPDVPDAQVINSFQFIELLELLHEKSQSSLPVDRRTPLSEAFRDHIEMRLLHSKTVIQIEAFGELPFYGLARMTYSPTGQQERTYTVIEDVAEFFTLRQAWVDERPDVLRAVETLDIAVEDREQALQELSSLLQDWADKYHREGGEPMVLQMAVGKRLAD